jgi:hypothetical protein
LIIIVQELYLIVIVFMEYSLFDVVMINYTIDLNNEIIRKRKLNKIFNRKSFKFVSMKHEKHSMKILFMKLSMKQKKILRKMSKIYWIGLINGQRIIIKPRRKRRRNKKSELVFCLLFSNKKKKQNYKF